MSIDVPDGLTSLVSDTISFEDAPADFIIESVDILLYVVSVLSVCVCVSVCACLCVCGVWFVCHGVCLVCVCESVGACVGVSVCVRGLVAIGVQFELMCGLQPFPHRPL